jgi:hypothetical protein
MGVSGPLNIQAATTSFAGPESPDPATIEGWSDPMPGLLLGAGAVAGAILIWARQKRTRSIRTPEPKAAGTVSGVQDRRAGDTASVDLAAAIESIFQRQVMDGERRLGDPHWQSGTGRNVGYDVLEATHAARGAVQTALASSGDRSLVTGSAVDALDALIADWRKRPGDDDGYGIATLHEIRRDLSAL